jgi:long-chain acyl-CoA synthetase
MPELSYVLKDSEARVLICDRDPGPLAALVERVVRVGEEYESLLARATPVPLGAGVCESDLAGLFYTGGTTAAAKGVMLTHRNLLANTMHRMVAFPFPGTGTGLLMAPMFHAAGTNCILSHFWQGRRMVTMPAFDPGRALDLIEEHGITETLGVPSMLAAIAEEQLRRPRRVASMKQFSHGGSPIATETLRRVHAAFPEAVLVEAYGATELSPLATLYVGEEAVLDQPLAQSCGRALRGVGVRIADSAGRTLPPGEVGEVVVRGANVMAGYWHKPEETAAALRAGEYWTGDLGHFDAAGYLFLVDRRKDMIISGGENVYSMEVEEVLYRHPAVLEVAVFGVPDEKWGEAVHAVVVPRPGAQDPQPGDLIAYCREWMASYKVPKALEIRHEPLPKSGPGKVLKRELRAPFWSGHDRAVH